MDKVAQNLISQNKGTYIGNDYYIGATFSIMYWKVSDRYT